MVKSLVYCQVLNMAFSAYIYGKMQHRYFFLVLSQGEAYAHFFKPHSFFFVRASWPTTGQLQLFQKKKQWQNTWGEGEWAARIDWAIITTATL